MTARRPLAGLVGRYRRWMRYAAASSGSAVASGSGAPSPRRTLARMPRVELPPDPVRRPGCYCGRTWPDTPRGWAAAGAHNAWDLPQCGEAFRKRERDRAKARRDIIAADPVLAAQTRQYRQETDERRRERAHGRSSGIVDRRRRDRGVA